MKDFKKSFSKKTPSYEDIQTKDATRPIKEGSVVMYLNQKALKGLPRSGSSITPRVDPYTQILPESVPYALLNGMNPIAGGNYGGNDNLDGGNIRQLITSEQSTFLHCFDSFSMSAKLNYRYLPMNKQIQSGSEAPIGYGIAEEMVKSIDEIQSLASATTYYALPINNYKVITSIPYLSKRSTDSDDTCDLSLPGPMYELCIGYQVILQAGAQAIQAFNKFRMNMGEMMRMSWDRETPLLNSFFGLTQKKSFLGAIKSLSYCLNGEYFDQEWLLQAAALINITSRRSNALTEPLLEAVVTHELPDKFILYPTSISGTAIFDLATMDAHAAKVSDDHTEFAKYGYDFSTFGGMLDVWSRLLSVQDTLAWVRTRRAGTSDMTEQVRFRMINYILEELTYFFGVFKPAMADLRGALDVLSRSNVNHWSKIKGLIIVRDTDTKIVRNLTLEDMFTSLCAGGVSMDFNTRTYRWTGHTPWNIYLGLPEYDAKSGGCFLSFSTKILNSNGQNDAYKWVPRAFFDIGRIQVLNRLGTLKRIQVNQVDTTKNKILARLNPLPSESIKIRVPYPADTTGMTVIDEAMLNWALVKVLGYAATANPNLNTTSITLESDTLCYLNFEVDDISSEMITYARSHGPFVVNVNDENVVGFLQFKA